MDPKWLEPILRKVEKPARYVGNEWNSSRRWSDSLVKVVLAYPEVYEVGISNIGLQILYSIINSRDDAFAERTYLPWPDMQEQMAARGFELYSLESFKPVKEFDLLGISLQHELNFTNVLSLLHSSGIGLRACCRKSGPLVLAGGPAALNPEPMHAFFDFFVIGDGEEVIGEIIERAGPFFGPGKSDREGALEALRDIDGLYFPDGNSRPVKKRTVADLNDARYPAAPIVPSVEAVHDRAVVEIMRGCTRGCRFCQAGVIYRPVRERSPGCIANLAGEILSSTGYSELSLSSLSSSDHSAIEKVLQRLMKENSETSFSLPSLRADRFGLDLAKAVAAFRRSGLTFAPEAGTERLRSVINKGITEEGMLEIAELAFKSGWTGLKLYFMIGLPTETEEDVEGIIRLCKAVLKIGSGCISPAKKGRLKLNVSVSNFVPKAHTPFQWLAFEDPKILERKQRLIRDNLRDRRIKLKWHDIDSSLVEAALARGGRELSPVIEDAWKRGARFDSWSDSFHRQIWEEAFESAGLDLLSAATRFFPQDSALPWEHIESGVNKRFLLSELERARELLATADCRWDKCHDCGACDGQVSLRVSK